MMSFGWRPNVGCYSSALAWNSGGTAAGASTPGTAGVAASSCPSVPSWFWLLVGAGAVAGIAEKGKRK